MKDYDKNKEHLYHEYWDVDYFYGWAMPQKLPVNGFKWVKNIPEFDKSFIKSYKEENDKDISLKLISNT